MKKIYVITCKGDSIAGFTCPIDMKPLIEKIADKTDNLIKEIHTDRETYRKSKLQYDVRGTQVIEGTDQIHSLEKLKEYFKPNVTAGYLIAMEIIAKKTKEGYYDKNNTILSMLKKQKIDLEAEHLLKKEIIFTMIETLSDDLWQRYYDEDDFRDLISENEDPDEIFEKPAVKNRLAKKWIKEISAFKEVCLELRCSEELADQLTKQIFEKGLKYFGCSEEQFNKEYLLNEND